MIWVEEIQTVCRLESRAVIISKGSHCMTAYVDEMRSMPFLICLLERIAEIIMGPFHNLLRCL